MKIEINLTSLALDEVKFTEKLFDILDEQNKQAARQWLRAVLLRVPTFTGEARGSLLPLGAFLQEYIPIHVKEIRKGHSPSIGAEQSEFKFQRGINTGFTFTEGVVHYIINEYYDVNPPIHLTHGPRPWFSFLKGREAYRAYMEKYLIENLPNIADFMFVRGIATK